MLSLVTLRFKDVKRLDGINVKGVVSPTLPFFLHLGTLLLLLLIIIIIKTLFNEGIHPIVTITLINLWPSTYILRTTKNYIKYMKYINI